MGIFGTVGAQFGDALADVHAEVAHTLRNEFVMSARVNARDVMNASKVIATRVALEKLQEVLA